MYRVKFFLDQVYKYKRECPDLTVDSLSVLPETVLTKRICLGLANTFVDFLGMACPFVLRFKLLMKELFLHGLSWDEPVPEVMKRSWVDLIIEAVQTDSLCFPRAARPPNVCGNPSLVIFTDGSDAAFCACVYIRWRVSDLVDGEESYSAHLLCAKAKVTPLSGLTTPRVELNSLVLGSRLALTAARALKVEKFLCPTDIYMLSDSECSIVALDKTSSNLKPFFHNRVVEIGENVSEMRKICEVEEVYHVPGKLNVADLGTRSGVKVEQLGSDTVWQKGPSFLSLRRELWPVTRPTQKYDVPDEEIRGEPQVYLSAALKVKLSRVVQSDPGLCYVIRDDLDSQVSPLLENIMAVMNYSNCLDTVKRILARLFQTWQGGKELGKMAPVKETLEKAEQMILVSAMPRTVEALRKGKLFSLLPCKVGNLLVTRGRVGEEPLSDLLGVSYLPILMPDTRAAFLYMYQSHVGKTGLVHKSVAETLTRSRALVWIHKGKDLAKSIVRSCPECKIQRKELLKQQISSLKPASLKMCRPWTNVSLDFAGPVLVKGVVNSRAKKKCWILVYVCQNTKAVCLLATSGYDTSCFLMRHEEFVARKGNPSLIVSDRGSQLVSAGHVLASKKSPEKWDWDRICER